MRNNGTQACVQLFGPDENVRLGSLLVAVLIFSDSKIMNYLHIIIIDLDSSGFYNGRFVLMSPM